MNMKYYIFIYAIKCFQSRCIIKCKEFCIIGFKLYLFALITHF